MRNCVKCLGPITSDEFVVNRYMAYCGECAKLLHLGESKESKMLSDFHVPGRRPPEEEKPPEEHPIIAGGEDDGVPP